MFGTFLDQNPGMIDKMPVCPYPSMEERGAWEALEAEDREDVLSLYEGLRGVPYPMLTASQYMAFARTGNRKVFENPYFLRRKKLIASVLHM